MSQRSPEGYCYDCPIASMIARHKSQFLDDDGTLGEELITGTAIDFAGDLSITEVEEGLSALGGSQKVRDVLRAGMSNEELTILRALADNLITTLGSVAVRQECPGENGQRCGIHISRAPELGTAYATYRQRLENNMIA